MILLGLVVCNELVRGIRPPTEKDQFTKLYYTIVD